MLESITFYFTCIGAMATGILVTRHAYEFAAQAALATVLASIVYLVLTNA